MAGDADLDVVVAIRAVKAEQAVAYIALGDRNDHPTGDRRRAGDIAIAHSARDRNGSRARSGRDNARVSSMTTPILAIGAHSVPPPGGQSRAGGPAAASAR